MKKAKLTESQIRKIVREHVLQEFKVFNQSLANLSTCERIDLPDRMFASAGGRATVKKIEQTAAFAAQLYGVPGMFCNFVSAVMGDNSGFEPNRPDDISSSGSGRAGRQRFIQNVVYSGESQWATTRGALFITNMTSQHSADDATKKRAVDADFKRYKELVAKVNSAKRKAKAVDVVREINSVLGLPNKGSVSKARELVRAQNGNQGVVKDRAVSEALELLRSTTNANLLAMSDRYNSRTSAQDLKTAYNEFFSYTSS